MCFIVLNDDDDDLRWTNIIVTSTAFLSVHPHCMNTRRNRCQEDLNSFPLRELEETTRTSSYYVDED